jgi:hypothetical protein
MMMIIIINSKCMGGTVGEDQREGKKKGYWGEKDGSVNMKAA